MKVTDIFNKYSLVQVSNEDFENKVTRVTKLRKEFEFTFTNGKKLEISIWSVNCSMCVILLNCNNTINTINTNLS